MSKKISEMTGVTVPVGTEYVPAINVAGEPIKIPVSAFLEDVYLASMTTDLSYADAGGGLTWFNTPIWS